MPDNNDTFIEDKGINYAANKSAPDFNQTHIENESIKDSNPTFIEPPQSEVIPSPPTPKIIMLGEITYEIINRLSVASAEADIFLIRNPEGQENILKFYRTGIEPKEEVIEILKDLPETSVIKIIDSGKKSSGRFYEIQEYAKFGTLSDYIKTNQVTSKFITNFFKELDKCLVQIHSRDIIHRDIKPANILIRNMEPLELVLTDFGISSIASLSLHQTSLSRTILYSSPESMSGVISKSTDYWAVGLIALEMLLNKNPFDGVDDKIIMFTLATKNVPCVNEVPADFVNIIKGLLTREPKKRWQHKEVKNWLAGINDIPVYFEEQSDNSEIFFKKAESNAAQSPARKKRPYKFINKDYFSFDELSIQMAYNWEKALKDFESNELRDWIVRELHDKETQVLYDDIINDRKLEKDEKLFEFLCRIESSLPFIYKGFLITQENILNLAMKILKKNASKEEIELLKKLKNGKLIEKYYKINGNEHFYKLFNPLIEDWKLLPDNVEMAAKAVLLNFSEKYKSNLIESVQKEFDENIVISECKGFLSINLMLESIIRVKNNKYNNIDLVLLSCADEDNYVNENKIIHYSKSIIENDPEMSDIFAARLKKITKETIEKNLIHNNSLINKLQDLKDDIISAEKLGLKYLAKLFLINFREEYKNKLSNDIKNELKNTIVVSSCHGHETLDDTLSAIERVIEGNNSIIDLLILSEIERKDYVIANDLIEVSKSIITGNNTKRKIPFEKITNKVISINILHYKDNELINNLSFAPQKAHKMVLPLFKKII